MSEVALTYVTNPTTVEHKFMNMMYDKIKSLEAQLSEARKVISIYANEVHWQGNDGHEEKGYKINRLCYEFGPYVDDSEELYKEENYGAQIPVIKQGKHAREFLSKYPADEKGG